MMSIRVHPCRGGSFYNKSNFFSFDPKKQNIKVVNLD